MGREILTLLAAGMGAETTRKSGQMRSRRALQINMGASQRHGATRPRQNPGRRLPCATARTSIRASPARNTRQSGNRRNPARRNPASNSRKRLGAVEKSPIRRSNSSRNLPAVRELCWAYHSIAPSASFIAAGWNLTVAGIKRASGYGASGERCPRLRLEQRLNRVPEPGRRPHPSRPVRHPHPRGRRGSR